VIRRQLICLSAFAGAFFLGCLPAAPVAAVAAVHRPAGTRSSSLPVGWRLPIDGPPIVLRPFAPPPAGQPWQRGHRGIDLAVFAGTLVRASAAGLVSFAGPVAGRSVVVLLHGSLRSTYEPVRPLVRVGQRVGSGQVVGSLEPLTQHCGRPCLHWGLLRGSVYLDPWPERSAVRLLPFTGDAGLQPPNPGGTTGMLGSRSTARATPAPTQAPPVGVPIVTAGATLLAGITWARRRARARSPAR